MQKTHQVQRFELDLFNEQVQEKLRFLKQIIDHRGLTVLQAKSLITDSAPKYLTHPIDQSVTFEDYAFDGEVFYWVEATYGDPWCASTRVDEWRTMEQFTYDVIPVDDGTYSSMDPNLVRLLAIAPEGVITQFVDWAMNRMERYPNSKEAIEYLRNFGR